MILPLEAPIVGVDFSRYLHDFPMKCCDVPLSWMIFPSKPSCRSRIFHFYVRRYKTVSDGTLCPWFSSENLSVQMERCSPKKKTPFWKDVTSWNIVGSFHGSFDPIFPIAPRAVKRWPLDDPNIPTVRYSLHSMFQPSFLRAVSQSSQITNMYLKTIYIYIHNILCIYP